MPVKYSELKMELSQQHQSIIDGIEAVCKKRNIKLTSQRKIVLAIMLKSEKAMSAYELLDLLKIEEPHAKPPTIYRVLEFLLEQDFIHKVESSNSYVICPHFNQLDHISILIICDNCKQITESNSEQVADTLKALAKQQQFQIKHSVIEIHGLCHTCKLITQ
ncbi:zinc uptake transcriptional repressor Zur [Frischella sp. Ac48]|uniref:Ferric uptake regulation protein n=1 Tax=Frischella japonica TaxID=2741544 RepID=A0ABR7QW86_9GAMM|nr:MULTISPECIES: zinc uptake transcriptional repressor Zur [Frischella]MBC9130465.1 zinc uptake transcriptional repressor Zur [Frischella japonica]MBX4132327.1 zinc uptake transcriptional repressor Zur [Frischella sp. Ac48]